MKYKIAKYNKGERSMNKLLKNKQGVTLIALVVTIVILIILAGVSMAMVLGNNGIFEQAKKGANSMASAESNTQEGFNSMSSEIDKILNGNGSLEKPEQPEETKSEIERAKETGKEFTDPKTEITDSKGNKVVIPGGFKVAKDSGDTVEQGIVIEDVSATEDENVKGSQFVWIPVGTFIKDDGSTSSEIILGRYTFNKTDGTPTLVQAAYTKENPENYTKHDETEIINSRYIELAEYRQGTIDNSNHDNDLNATSEDLKSFVESTKRNGGYYIARYEASYASGSSTLDYKAASKQSKANSINSMNYTARTLWNFITQLDASKVSINTYSGSTTVKSDLMNSYAWDTAIVYIQEAGNANYANQISKNKLLSDTGANSDEVCKINDMASNLYEWTTESSKINRYVCTDRGGAYIELNAKVTDRFNNNAFNVHEYFGFRLCTYIIN